MLPNLFRRRIALTNEHGSWVFLLSPLLIGLFAGGTWSVATVYLIVISLAIFLVRHPITIIVKIYSGRRSRRDLSAASFWVGVYGIIGASAFIGLVIRGFGSLLLLILPGALVFIWHLYLVSKRSERRQMGVEIVASGMLAWTAAAGYWVGWGEYDPLGWWLWGLTWLQSAASIVYAYLRLGQRTWLDVPEYRARFRMSWRALLYALFNLLFVFTFSQIGVLPAWLFLPYAVQAGETLWGVLRPAIGVRPTSIGLRQLVISSIFTVLFMLAWNV